MSYWFPVTININNRKARVNMTKSIEQLVNIIKVDKVNIYVKQEILWKVERLPLSLSDDYHLNIIFGEYLKFNNTEKNDALVRYKSFQNECLIIISKYIHRDIVVNIIFGY